MRSTLVFCAVMALIIAAAAIGDFHYRSCHERASAADCLGGR